MKILHKEMKLSYKTHMDNLIIESSAFTPFVRFNRATGVMVIKGRAIPDSPDEFWMPIISWFEGYLLHPSPETIFKIDLEYFNISSSKRILFLLYKLNNLAKEGSSVKVDWYYKLNDEDMYEVGQDYKYMVKVPFEFHPYEEQELAMAM